MIDDCIKQLRTAIFFILTVILFTYFTLNGRLEQNQFLRDYGYYISLIKILDVPTSALHAEFEDTNEESMLQQLSESMNAVRALAHWRHASPTTFVERYCGDWNPIQSQNLVDDIGFYFGPSKVECKLNDDGTASAALGKQLSHETCEFNSSSKLIKDMTKEIDALCDPSDTECTKCELTDSELSAWAQDLTIKSFYGRNALSINQAKLISCNEWAVGLRGVINSRIGNYIGAPFQIEILINDGLSEEPHVAWYTDVKFTKKNYDGEVDCHLSSGSFYDDPYSEFNTEPERIMNLIHELLINNSKWNGVNELVKSSEKIKIDDYQINYRRLLDEYRKQEFQMPLLQVTIRFRNLVYSSLGITAALLIWACSLLRRLTKINRHKIDTPWGLTAVSEIGGSQSVQALIESVWFFAYYVLISAAPISLVVFICLDHTIKFDDLINILIGLVSLYAIYAFVLLVSIIKNLWYVRKTN